MAHGSAVTTQYLAEVFAPRGTREQLEADSWRVRRVAEELTGSGEPVRYLHSFLLPREEIALYFLEAAHCTGVADALYAAGLEAERITSTIAASGSRPCAVAIGKPRGDE